MEYLQYNSLKQCAKNTRVGEASKVLPVIEQVHIIPSKGCWFLKGKVENLHIDWLMDCGADPNILSVRVFEKLSSAVKASMQPANIKLVAANGKGIVSHGR